MGNPEGNKEREAFADAINRAAFGSERVLLRRLAELPSFSIIVIGRC
jgi:hypothetical protein